MEKDSITVALEKLYLENEEAIKDYQFCVDMSRRWVIKKVLKDISHNYGLHYEEDAQIEILDTIEDEIKIDQLLNELESINNFQREKKKEATLSPFVIRRGNKEKELNAPFAEYNSLYALLIILWTFGDQREDGEDYDNHLKAKIERALLQIVINYRNYPVIRKILDEYPYRFILPDVQKGDKVFSSNAKPEDQLAFEDSGFLTLLSRILVLYGVYGIADHSLLDPIIREMYVDLLFARNRRNSKYPNLWSQNDVEVFSTFRAVQTLTFYYLYQQGKELNQQRSGNQSKSEFFREVAQFLEQVEITSPQPATEPKDDKVEFRYDNFKEFYLSEANKDWPLAMNDEQTRHIKRFQLFGDYIIYAIENGDLDEEKGEKLLNQLNSCVQKPWDDNGKPLHRPKIEAWEERYRFEEKIAR